MPRPTKDFDKTQFESLCGLQCTREEICGYFGCTPKTLTGWCKRTYGKPFAEVFEDYKGVGKVSLRRKQWRLADTNSTMAIWLGRQYLGQRDKPLEAAPNVPTGQAVGVTVDDLYGD